VQKHPDYFRQKEYIHFSIVANSLKAWVEWLTFDKYTRRQKEYTVRNGLPSGGAPMGVVAKTIWSMGRTRTASWRRPVRRNYLRMAATARRDAGHLLRHPRTGGKWNEYEAPERHTATVA
jgi:hypothetical protein